VGACRGGPGRDARAADPAGVDAAGADADGADADGVEVAVPGVVAFGGAEVRADATSATMPAEVVPPAPGLPQTSQ